MDRREAILYSIAWICAALVLIAIVAALWNFAVQSNEQSAQNIQTCIENGGQWILSNCVKGAAG